MESPRTSLAFAALSLFFLSTTVLWLHLDRSPPSWDDAYYLTSSLNLYDALTTGGLPAYARQFPTVMGLKPPLIAALPTPMYLFLGRKAHAALAVNLVAMLVIFYALFRMGRKYVSPGAGLLAVFIVGSMPVLYGLSRWYLVECGLTAIVCIVICLVAEWNDGGVRKAFLLGIACGFGLLMKFSFPLYVLVPLLFLTLNHRPTVLRAKTFLAFAAPAAVLATPWYVLHLRHAVEMALLAGSAERAKIYLTGDIFSITEIWRYLVNVSNVSPTLYFITLPVLLLAFGRTRYPLGKQGLQLCALWATPLLFLTFSHYRDLRYAAPLFPALALALAILIDAAIERHGRAAAAATALFLTLPTLSMLQTSFESFGHRTFNLGSLLLVQPKFVYVRMYDPTPWPHREILTGIYRTAKFTGSERKRIVVGTDSLSFNTDNLALAAIENQLPFDIRTMAYETAESTLLPLLDSASYFIYKEGGEPEGPFNPLRTDAIKAVQDGGKFVELPTPPKLPDGGIVHIFERIRSDRFQHTGAFINAGLDNISDCHVTFDGKLELAGLSIQRAAQNLEVKYRWRCLKPVNRDYWCFTHIIDQQGKIVGYLDHPILDGQPPTSSWTEGGIAIEKLTFRLPDTQNPGPYRLRFGLFHRASGERLRITASDFPMADGNTAAVASERQ